MNRSQPPHYFSRRKSLGWALTAIYVPFFLAGIVLFLQTTCTHCRHFWLLLFPALPWITGGHILRSMDTYQNCPALLFTIISLLVNIIIISLITLMIRKGAWWRIGGLFLALAIFTWQAYVAYALIQS